MHTENSDRQLTELRFAWPVLPLTCAALFAVLVSGADIQSAYGKTAEDILQGIGIAIACLGAVLRFAASGSSTSSTHRAGLYSVMHDPMLLGGILIAFGLSLATQVWWSAAIVAVWAAFRLMSARRSAPASALSLPLIFPSPSKWISPEEVFSWKTALLRESGTFYVIVLLTVVLEVSIDLRTGHATPQSWPSDWPVYFTVFALASAVYLLTRRITVDSSKQDVAEQPAPATRGLLVEGRAGLVDTLENLISGGQQEAILTATLDAASVRAGEKLLDVGCGTGKLAVAAARRTSTLDSVFGIDATPAIIRLAQQRARDERSNANFRVGVGESLPFPDGEFNAVTSSYFFHHLPSDVKAQALLEMWRVLASGGRLVVTDYGKPQNLLGYLASIPMRFDFHEYVRPQLRGELEEIIGAAEIGEVEVVASFLGYINVLRLVKG